MPPHLLARHTRRCPVSSWTTRRSEEHRGGPPLQPPEGDHHGCSVRARRRLRCCCRFPDPEGPGLRPSTPTSHQSGRLARRTPRCPLSFPPATEAAIGVQMSERASPLPERSNARFSAAVVSPIETELTQTKRESSHHRPLEYPKVFRSVQAPDRSPAQTREPGCSPQRPTNAGRRGAGSPKAPGVR